MRHTTPEEFENGGFHQMFYIHAIENATILFDLYLGKTPGAEGGGGTAMYELYRYVPL